MKVQHLHSLGLAALSLSVVLTMERVAAACEPEYYADGACDDFSNNNAECGYDAGDCCEASCVDADRTCGDFNCIDPAYQCDLTLAGDGNCDVKNNIGVCGYDGGDCCEVSCVSGPNDCGVNTAYNCIDPDYACDPGLAGDGRCDRNNNAEACDYDGGDCCEDSCVDGLYQCVIDAAYNCIDPDYQCDVDLAGDGKCDVNNNVDVCGYDGGDCCSCTCKDHSPRQRRGHHGHNNNCQDVEDSETCKDPSAPCLEGYVEAGTLTTVTVEANAFKKTPRGGPRGGRGAREKRRPESGGDSGCARQGCEAKLTRDGDVRSDESRWCCAQKITLDEEQLCETTFSFEQAQDIEYLQVAFWKPDEMARSLKVTSNGEDMGTFESSSESVFTAFDIGADGVKTLTLTTSGLDKEEWISLLEVRFMVEEKANKKKAE